MKGFLRTLRLTLRSKTLLVGAVLCSLLIGGLWAANIGTVYPVVVVVLRGESVQDWLARDAAESEQAVARVEAETDRPAAVREARVANLRAAIARARRLEGYARAVLPADPFQTLLAVVAFLLAGVILRNVCHAGHLLIVEAVVRRVWLDLQERCFAKVLNLEQGALDKTHTSELTAYFKDDVRALADGVRAACGGGVREPIKMAACLLGAAVVHWRLLLCSLAVIPIAAVVITVLGRLVKTANRQMTRETIALSRRLAESVNLLGTIRAFALEDYERGRVRAAAEDLGRRAAGLVRYNALARGTAEVLGLGVVCSALLLGGYLLLTQQTQVLGVPVAGEPVTMSSLLVFFALLIGAHDPARKCAALGAQLQKAVTAADRVYELLDRPAGVASPPDPVPFAGPPRELAFDRVAFAYGPGVPALTDVSFRIRAGETLAVVGRSGAGKSTLAHLVLRLYDPTGGHVRLDGVDVRDRDLQELRGHIGFVPQTPVLFDDTVGENIRLGALAATPADVETAARIADADTFIGRLDAGYAHPVGERGGRLSGGQRQRVAIARAVLRRPAVLVLDEATSQIDPESERLIQAAMSGFLADRITILITHRLAAARPATRILVLDAGRVVDVGTHDELIGRCELYRVLATGEGRAAA